MTKADIKPLGPWVRAKLDREAAGLNVRWFERLGLQATPEDVAEALVALVVRLGGKPATVDVLGAAPARGPRQPRFAKAADKGA